MKSTQSSEVGIAVCIPLEQMYNPIFVGAPSPDACALSNQKLEFRNTGGRGWVDVCAPGGGKCNSKQPGKPALEKPLSAQQHLMSNDAYHGKSTLTKVKKTTQPGHRGRHKLAGVGRRETLALAFGHLPTGVDLVLSILIPTHDPPWDWKKV